MKRIIPPIKFSADLGVTDATDRQDIAVDDIVVLDNLNLRVEGTEDHVAGIRELASKIEANGFYPDKPLAGYVRQDGKVVLTDGHRRLAAARYLNDQSLDGPVVTTLPVVVSPGTLDDVTIKMIASSEGRELTMLEKGIGVRRLMGNGMDKDEIARRLGCSVKTIDNYLLVASAPAKARDLLLDGRVTSTQVLRAKGDAEKLTAMVKKAAEAGRQRARPSDAPAPIKREDIANPAVVVAKTPIEPTPETPAPDDSFTVTVTKDADMRTVMQRLAAEIRKRVPHEQDESDNALVNGTITVSVTLQQPEKPKRAKKVKTEDDRVPAELAHAIPDDL